MTFSTSTLGSKLPRGDGNANANPWSVLKLCSVYQVSFLAEGADSLLLTFLRVLLLLGEGGMRKYMKVVAKVCVRCSRCRQRFSELAETEGLIIKVVVATVTSMVARVVIPPPPPASGFHSP